LTQKNVKEAFFLAISAVVKEEKVKEEKEQKKKTLFEQFSFSKWTRGRRHSQV
jgi:hypothetical protein